MYNKKKEKLILTQPKIYSAPQDKQDYKLPKTVIVIIVGLILIIVIVFLLFLSPFFKIKNINIIGNPPEDSQFYINQFKNENVFLVKSNDIEKTLETKYSEFSSINVYKGIPNILKIEFIERDAYIVWRSNNQNYLVDANGLAYKKIDSLNSDIPLVIDNKNLPITPPSQVVTANIINFVLNAKAKIKDSGFKVKQFEINDTIFQVSAIINKKLKIIFDITRSLSDQMDAFNQAYSQNKNDIRQYVDVRVEGKVYYQ